MRFFFSLSLSGSPSQHSAGKNSVDPQNGIDSTTSGIVHIIISHVVVRLVFNNVTNVPETLATIVLSNHFLNTSNVDWIFDIAFGFSLAVKTTPGTGAILDIIFIQPTHHKLQLKNGLLEGAIT